MRGVVASTPSHRSNRGERYADSNRVVEDTRLGSAYALMTFCQQIGWAVMAWAIGRSNDAFGASAAHPGGYVPGILMFAALGFIGLTCSFLLWRLEHGPEGHGLDTIRA